jgi:hypothetical protein
MGFMNETPCPFPAPSADEAVAAIRTATAHQADRVLQDAIVKARAEGTDPVTFERSLISLGWSSQRAREVADRLAETDSQPLVWWGWYGSLGVIVASLAAAAHAALDAGDQGGLTEQTGSVLATALTIAVTAVPIAAWCRTFVRRAVTGIGRWSPVRRSLVDVLMWSTGVVAVVRALVYVGQVFRGFFVPDVDVTSAWDLGQVLVTIIAAGTLFSYSLRERADVRQQASAGRRSN